MYKWLNAEHTTLGTLDGSMSIPWPPAESEGRKAKAWIDQGNTPAEYVAPPLPPAADRRAARYKQEADPLLLAAVGYQIELEAKPGDNAITQKLAKAKSDYLAAKTKIRNEIPD